jgi:hypothetical protein
LSYTNGISSNFKLYFAKHVCQIYMHELECNQFLLLQN